MIEVKAKLMFEMSSWLIMKIKIITAERFKLHNHCSSCLAEQMVIIIAWKRLESTQNINTDSRIFLVSLKNKDNHNQLRKKRSGILTANGWPIGFKW